jgi:hypothetical protein
MQGKTIAEASAILGIPEEHFIRLLEGQWKPSRGLMSSDGFEARVRGFWDQLGQHNVVHRSISATGMLG